METKNKFIGSGLLFPIVLNVEGRPTISDDTTLINASLKHILSWPVRNKFFNEAFGARLTELLEEPDDAILKTLIKHFIIDAIKKWERRVVVGTTDINILSNNNGKINISIHYKVRNTKIEETFIFPFYREIIY